MFSMSQRPNLAKSSLTRSIIVKMAAAIAVVFTICLVQPVTAQEVTPEEAEKTIQSLEKSLEQVSDQIIQGSLTPAETGIYLKRLEDIISKSHTFSEKAEARRSNYQSLIDALGPPPGESAPPESDEVREKRKNLSSLLASSGGRIKRAGLVATEAELLLGELTRANRARLTEKLFEQGVSPIAIDPWLVAIPEFVTLSVVTFVKTPLNLMTVLAAQSNRLDDISLAMALAVLVVVVAWPTRRLLLERYGRRSDEKQPTYTRRVVAGFVEGIARGLIPALFVLAVWLLLADPEILGERFAIIFQAVTSNLVIFFFAYGLISAALATAIGEWRILPIDDMASSRLARRLEAGLVIYVIFDTIHQSFSWTARSVEFESVYAFVFMLVLYPVLASVFSRRIWHAGTVETMEADKTVETPENVPASTGWDTVRRLIALSLISLPATAAAGYPELSIFLAHAAVMTGIIVGTLWLVRWLKSEAVTGLLDSQTAISRKIREVLALRHDMVRRLVFWTNLFLDLVLLFVAGVLLLPLWGFGAEETGIWLARIFRGVQIGSFTFSLFNILMAIGLFLAILAVTRLLQRGMERHFLPNITQDQGVRDALKTGVGYLGIVIAALIGISTLGLDLTNLALVAGALSVGIGFGLQNVVNNFVSGLILLIERPIKQGDWVIIGSHEGTVKKVNVRSTEVETFQRASVIIPNADLISSPVTNWTHKNIQGRVDIAVGVAYGSDVEKVRSILLEIGRSHPDVLQYPEPYVLFQNFGNSSLDFELRCYLKDIGNYLRVPSDLRFAIDKAFHENDIEIPFPQRVVHLADGNKGESKLSGEFQ